MEICMACISNFKSSQDLDEECRFWSGRRSPTSNSPGSLHFAPALYAITDQRHPIRSFFMISQMLWLISADRPNKLLLRYQGYFWQYYPYKFCHFVHNFCINQQYFLQKAMFIIDFKVTSTYLGLDCNFWSLKI